MTWLFEGSEIEQEQIPDKAFGFIYIITEKSTGRRYLGKKQLKFKKSKQVKGKKKKYLVDSDWRDYWSSSPYLQELVKEKGADEFTREIILFCFTSGELSYCEECLQYSLGVLETDEWMNGNIRSRIFGKNVLKYQSLPKMRELTKSLA